MRPFDAGRVRDESTRLRAGLKCYNCNANGERPCANRRWQKRAVQAVQAVVDNALNLR